MRSGCPRMSVGDWGCVRERGRSGTKPHYVSQEERSCSRRALALVRGCLEC